MFDDDELLYGNTPELEDLHLVSDERESDNRIKDERDIFDNRIDDEVLTFIRDINKGMDIKPITVGFISEKEATAIKNLTGLDVYGNRIVLDKDAVLHINKRHGINGLADHSMQNEEDIAKISYILTNYDSVMLGDKSSHIYRTAQNTPAPHIILSKKNG